jgi:hypothetical protein
MAACDTFRPHPVGTGIMATRVSSHRRWLLREVPHIVALFVWAAFGFAILTYFVDSASLQRWMLVAYRGTAAAKTQTDASNGQKPYNGSIFFVPPRGELCAEWMFDNRNGDMWDNGRVKCPGPPTPDKPSEGMSAQRMQAIGKAFKE